MKGKGKSRGGLKVKLELEDTSSHVVPGNSTSLIRESSNFSFVLQRKELYASDLRTIQFELEDQLINAVKRKRQLGNKIFSLETLHSRKDKRSRSTDSVEKKSSDERPPKKAKESSSKASASNHHKFIMPPLLDPHQEIPKPPKNDAPSRFWSHIEPFAADITQDIIKTVERWINPEETYENLQNIPEKGEHYSKVWPIEDLTEEIMEGSKSVENAKGLFSNSAQDTAEIERILKLGERETSTTVDDSECTLLDKLVYSLVGEKFMIQIDDTMNEFYNDDLLQEEKPCTVDSADESIEKRLYKDCIEAGVLESDTEESEDEKDEVYEELQELQRAFIPLNKYNIIKKKSLLAMAKARMGQQEIKKKLLEHDAKIMELYRMVSNARKNKTMNKKLEDQVKRTQRERKKLIRKLMEKS